MEISKIYITLKEAENLIFNRFLIIPTSRLKVTKAKELFSINILVNNLGIIKTGEHNLTILFSSVNTFEIPEVEKSLFNLPLSPKGELSFPKGETLYSIILV